MSNHHELLRKAQNRRDHARRARRMSRFLTQRADVERITAYAAELEQLADEMERRAANLGGSSRARDTIGERANA